ncbi:MAG: hypothetical protein PHE27_03465, partial [Alphaproteobacteria bacterium]|nr:hypothetical protein [Alphaproteobacteria bacterium]
RGGSMTHAFSVPEAIDFGAMGDSRFAPYLRMANVIVHCTRRQGFCRSCDLLPFGFSEREIAERWHMSCAMADVELRLVSDKGYGGDRDV